MRGCTQMPSQSSGLSGLPTAGLEKLRAAASAASLQLVEHGFAPREVFGWEDVETLLNYRTLKYPMARLVRDGSHVEPEKFVSRRPGMRGSVSDGALDLEKVQEGLNAGETLVLSAVERVSPKANAFARRLAGAIGTRVSLNVYATMGGSKGFRRHSDDTDVMVFQVAGRKAWQVYAPTGQEPELLANLVTGQMLYLPRGYPHEADPEEGSSLHVSAAVLRPTWRTLLKALAESGGPALEKEVSAGLTADALLEGLRSQLNSLSAEKLSEAISKCREVERLGAVSLRAPR